MSRNPSSVNAIAKTPEASAKAQPAQAQDEDRHHVTSLYYDCNHIQRNPANTLFCLPPTSCTNSSVGSFSRNVNIEAYSRGRIVHGYDAATTNTSATRPTAHKYLAAVDTNGAPYGYSAHLHLQACRWVFLLCICIFIDSDYECEIPSPPTPPAFDPCHKSQRCDSYNELTHLVHSSTVKLSPECDFTGEENLPSRFLQKIEKNTAAKAGKSVLTFVTLLLLRLDEWHYKRQRELCDELESIVYFNTDYGLDVFLGLELNKGKEAG
ncbi:hypothetical protein NLJ89_g7368 [Agrocybe chaxingu]|uniref:Uncharacterized protein n=1 Tax=Agrocybe chaxingu TaxID=84603 RepID=A0A9W8K4L2_9AGAR|nr:hypothetical protein NLJ89_g7368 [Agrocybe chaxingu]